MKPIYVIDDDDDVRDVIVFALESEQYEVLSFANGRIAYDTLKNQTENLPGLIIVDYLMPEMDGYEFINALRDIPAFKDATIALSTAMGHSEPSRISMKNVIELHKPMELDELLKVVKQYCS